MENDLGEKKTELMSAADALEYAIGRLNDIPHRYQDTDFRYLQNALADARGSPRPWPEHKTKKKLQ